MTIRALVFLMVLPFFLSGFSCAEEPIPTQPDHVIVYYFCTNYPCPRCCNMEKWTKEVIDSDFEGNKVMLKKVNIYAKGNEYFMEKYEICTDSVVLVLIKGGKEERFTNLARVWCNICYKEVFKRYIKEAITKYVKDL